MRLTPTEWGIVDDARAQPGQARHAAPTAPGGVGTAVRDRDRVPAASTSRAIRRKLEPDAVPSPLLHHRGRHGLPLRVDGHITSTWRDDDRDVPRQAARLHACAHRPELRPHRRVDARARRRRRRARHRAQPSDRDPDRRGGPRLGACWRPHPRSLYLGGPVGVGTIIALAQSRTDDPPLGTEPCRRSPRRRRPVGDPEPLAPAVARAARVDRLRRLGAGPARRRGRAGRVVRRRRGRRPTSRPPSPNGLWRAVLGRQPGTLAWFANFPDDPAHN